MTARTSLVALLSPEPARSRLDELCEFAPAGGTRAELALWFVRLVEWLRPLPGQRVEAKVKFLAGRLAAYPEWSDRVSSAFGELVAQLDLQRLFAHGGIPGHFHLAGALKEWLIDHLLPTACETSDAAQIVRLAFRERDIEWFARAPGLVALARQLLGEERRAALAHHLREAMVDLAHEIVAQGHAPSIRPLARAERSPFRGLYEAVATVAGDDPPPAALGAIRGRVRQCILFLEGHRRELVERGANLNTTFQLRRMQDQLRRLELLAGLCTDPSDSTIAGVSASIVYTVRRSFGSTRLLARSSDLVVENLVDSAATVGRSYLEDEHSSWRAAFTAGAGGGLLMVVATVVKLLVANLHLPTLYEGIAFSFNYAAAFCAAYLLHFTIATKLPAHTAAALARSVQERGGHRARIAAFVVIWKNTVRLQLAGLLGNIVVVGPLAFGITIALKRLTGHPLVSLEKAGSLLHANSALGPSVLYAALTGVFLWISSLLGASADNWTRTTRLSDRLATNVRVMKSIGEARARGYADAIASRAGPLFGNAALGFLLGLVPTCFALANLPVEIRHVTVSTGSVAVALATNARDHGAVAAGVVGVALIGIVNVAVSFLLALWLALRATHGLRASSAAAPLVRAGLRRWLSGPRKSARNAQ